MKNSKLIYIAGPTASGKTTLAIALAKHLNTEIVSCDSRQFYREMTIGTAVPSAEELAEVPHHFVQHLSIHDPYSVGDFRKDALNTLESLFKTNEYVIMVGGSGLYADAVIQGLDEFPAVDPSIRPQLNTMFENEGIEVLQELLKEHDNLHYQIVDQQNPKRLIRALEVSLSSGKPYSSFLGKKTPPDFFTTHPMVIHSDREELYQRINTRVDEMVEKGLEEEARSLFPEKGLNALQTVGYNEWFNHFEGKWDRETAIAEIKKNSRRYAKRQITWFKRDTMAQAVPTDWNLKDVIAGINP